MRKTKPIESRFWEKVNKTESCWVWVGSITGSGYGFLHYGTKTERKPYRAHRLSWELHYGVIPDGLWVLHKCDNRKCVNPDHLFIGDRSDNMRDCAEKGRVCTIGKSQLTHCKRGHEFTEENTIVNKYGHRRCKTCTVIANANYYKQVTKAIRARSVK